MIKKITNIVISIVLVAIFGCVVFIPEFRDKVDTLVLLEDSYPGYLHILSKAKTKSGEKLLEEYEKIDLLDEGTKERVKKHLFLYLDKDGFAEVKTQDIIFFLKNVENEYAWVEYITLVFSDETGIEIPLDRVDDSVYGFITEIGELEDVKAVDLKKALISQVDGITNLNRKYGIGNIVIYQFRTDELGNAIVDNNGVAGFEREFDSFYNEIMYRTLGEDGKPVLNQSGYAEVRRVYKSKDLISESYFGADGKALTLPMGYHLIAKEYDNKRVTKISYFDSNGSLTNCVNGYAIEEREYDNAGNIIKQCYINRDNELIVSPYGYAEIRREFDGQNNIIKEEYYDPDGRPLKNSAGYVAIAQEWNGGILVERTYLDEYGNPVNRSDGYSKAVWDLDENGTTWNLKLFDKEGNDVPLEGKNLVKDVKYGEDGWSEWMMPKKNTISSCFNIGSANLGKKSEGDIYLCKLEIEFKGVNVTQGREFKFWTQGSRDGKWTSSNVWNPSLVNYDYAPNDGVYSFTYVAEIIEGMDRVSRFDIGFRCDYWESGSFRVRNVEVIRGESDGEWRPGV